MLNERKNVCFIAGTRPEIIKVAPVINAFNSFGNDRFKVTLCLTGQHKSMAKQAMDIFGLKADHNMDIMSVDQTLNSISAKIFDQLPAIFNEIKPDLIFIQGDTTTAAISGLVAFNMKIPVAHIEAGLRTNNLDSPFPEELNRKIISNFSQFNFVPTENAKNALIKENCDAAKIFLTGNTIVDAVNFIKNKFDLSQLFKETFQFPLPFILITAHRRESFGQGFENICRAISDIADKNKDISFVYPVHLNPNVQNPVRNHLSGKQNIFLLNPLSYIEILSLQSNCAFCITDSGGIQEEAPSFGKYSIVLRDTTERIESVNMGFSELVGSDYNKIVNSVSQKINEFKKGNINYPKSNPFGDGDASSKIYNIIDKFFFND